MTDYGITKERDSEGNRKPIDHTFEFGGEEVTIQIMPPTISEVEELEQLENEDEIDASRLNEMLSEFIIKPEVDDPTMKEANAFAEGLMDYVSGGTELAQAAQEELESRGGSGNSTT